MSFEGKIALVTGASVVLVALLQNYWLNAVLVLLVPRPVRRALKLLAPTWVRTEKV